MAAIYKMAAQKAVLWLFRLNGNGFQRNFLRTLPAWSQMCHGQHFFQNGFQHGRCIYKMVAQKAVFSGFQRVFCLRYRLGLKCFMVNVFFSKWLPTWPLFTKWQLKKAVLWLSLLNGNEFRRSFLRTLPVRSRMCHGQHFFQNGFQHGRYLQNGSSKSSF